MEVLMDSEEQAHMKEILHTYQRRLWILEIKKAQKGIDTPADILMEMEDLQKAIARCQLQLDTLSQKKQSIPDLSQSTRTNLIAATQKQVGITFNDSFDHLTPEILNAVVRAIAGIIEISPDQVVIQKVMSHHSLVSDIAKQNISPEPRAMQKKDSAKFWSYVDHLLQNDKERLVSHANFQLGLSPKEIYQQDPNIFESTEEVYVIKQQILQRLSQDKGFHDLLEDSL
jgi:hypothetical protein